MATKRKEVAQASKGADPARSAAIAEKGIRTSRQFASYMSMLMADLATGRMEPQLAGAICNAGGKLLKVVEMEYRYGKRRGTEGGGLALL